MEEIAGKFFAQGGTLYTRDMPAGSLGVANPIGLIDDKTAQIALGSMPHIKDITTTDADGVIAELFHLAGKKRHYSDKEAVEAVAASTYGNDANIIIPGATPYYVVQPEANPFHSKFIKPKSQGELARRYSGYFHQIQGRYCSTTQR